MDLLIENGDMAVDDVGNRIEIYSIDEACQRVRLILSAVRGSFIYNRSFGADFSGIKESDNANESARFRCREALADEEGIDIGSVETDFSGERLKLLVEVITQDDRKYTEVETGEIL